MKIKRLVCCVILLAVSIASAEAQRRPGAAPAGPNPATLTEAQISEVTVPQVLYRLAAGYKQSGDVERLTWALKRMTVLLPNTGDLKLALASVYAERGDKSRAYETLLGMQQQGFGYDLADNSAFDSIHGTKLWTYLADNLKANLKPFGEGKVAFTLPGGDHLFESLAYDPKRKQFLVGSVRDGTISLVGKDGSLHDFIAPNADNGLWSVYAMAADPADDALYVASTSSVYFKGFRKEDYGKAGVFKFRLSTGKLLNKYVLTPENQPRTLSSIAIGGGAVFAADGLANIIYRIDGGALKPMVENPKLTSIRGLAVSGDGKRLYFADYQLGVFGIDLTAAKGFDVEYSPARLVLGGIDGLYWYGDDALVAIENGMSPRRVMRLRLDKDGRKIATAMPLDSSNPAFGLPTYGVIVGDGLYFIANSQKNEYDSYGEPKDAKKLEPVKVFRSDVRFAWEANVEAQPKLPPGAFKEKGKVPEPVPGLFGNVEGGASSTEPAKSGD
jgi:hypothetical protein